MVRIIAAVSCFVAAFHAVAERPQKSGARLERGPPEATPDQDGASQRRIGGIGDTLEEYTANIEHREKLITDSSKEGGDAQGGDSAMNVSLAELGSLAIECKPPDQLNLQMLPKNSATLLKGGPLGSTYRVSISGCPGVNDMVMKSVGVPANDQMNRNSAHTEIFVGESLLSQRPFKPELFQEPALVSTIAHMEYKQQQGTCFYMLMDYANHRDLKTALQNKQLTLKEKALIFHESLVGLARLHQHGIVHRDINHENIFLDTHRPIFNNPNNIITYQHPKIGEFRSSCCYRPGCKPHLDGALVPECKQARVGTQGYRSPRLAQAKPATPDDDLWSMGKLLFQLVYNQADTYITKDEKIAYETSNLKKFEGESLLSDEDTQRLTDNEAAGGGKLVALLDYLLCNGCPLKENHDVDTTAIKLSEEWLEDLNIDKSAPERTELKQSLQSCVGQLIHTRVLKRGPE